MSLDGIDLEAMTEEELRALMHEREVWRRGMAADQRALQAERDAAETEDKWAELQARKIIALQGQRGVRAEMLEIQAAIDVKGGLRKAEAQEIAENTPGAVFARIDGAAAGAGTGGGTLD